VPVGFYGPVPASLYTSPLIMTNGLAMTCETRPREFDRDWLPKSQVRSNETKRLAAGFDRSIAG